MIGRDSIIYVLSKLLPSGISFATSMVLTWLISPADYGLYGLGLAISMMASNLFFDWHALSVMRFFQVNHQNRAFLPTMTAMFVGLCGISLVVCALASLSGLTSAYPLLIWICLPGTWAYAWFEFAARIQVARFQAMRYFWMNLARNAAIFAAGAAAAWLTHNALVILAASFAAMFLAGLLYLPDDARPDFGRLDTALVRQISLYGWPIIFTMTLNGLSGAVTRPILDGLSGREAVGFFTVAYTLAQNTINVISSGVGSATYSMAVKAVDSGDTALARAQLSSNCALLFGLLLPSAIGVGMLAPSLARLFVSPQFVAPVAELTPWMAVAAFFVGLRCNYVDHAFQLGHRTKLQTLVMTVVAGSNIGLNFLLIPRYGYTGAGMAMAAASAIGLLLALIAAPRCYPLPYPWRTLGEVTLASAFLALSLWLMQGHAGLLWLSTQIAVASAVFGLVLMTFNTLGLRSKLLESPNVQKLLRRPSA
jgi:O-antigen/teichoic acid export membrane protein